MREKNPKYVARTSLLTVKFVGIAGAGAIGIYLAVAWGFKLIIEICFFST